VLKSYQIYFFALMHIYLAATGNIMAFPVYISSQSYENKNYTVMPDGDSRGLTYTEMSDGDSRGLTYTEMYFPTCEDQINENK
jgi:hypothetical protein